MPRDGYVEILIVWLIVAALVGWFAASRGRSGLVWFLLALVLSPLLVGIVLLIVGPGPVAATGRPVIGVADELTKLAALRDAGTITAEEYERQRAAVLLPAGPMRSPKGSLCGKCGKLLSPFWSERCNHCKGRFSDYPPVRPA